jgi:hypothetical protein
LFDEIADIFLQEHQKSESRMKKDVKYSRSSHSFFLQWPIHREAQFGLAWDFFAPFAPLRETLRVN